MVGCKGSKYNQRGRRRACGAKSAVAYKAIIRTTPTRTFEEVFPFCPGCAVGKETPDGWFCSAYDVSTPKPSGRENMVGVRIWGKVESIEKVEVTKEVKTEKSFTVAKRAIASLMLQKNTRPLDECDWMRAAHEAWCEHVIKSVQED
jgi:hypothetical protein